MLLYVVIAVVVIVIGVGIFLTAKRNGEIDRNGIVTDAVVTRVKEHESTDENGNTSYSYTYYVTYQTAGGQSVEAKLASGKSMDIRIGSAWDKDLHEGVHVRIKYLPEKPNYVIRVTD